MYMLKTIYSSLLLMFVITATSTHIIIGIIMVYIIDYTPFIKNREIWRIQLKRYFLNLGYSILGIWFPSQFNVFYREDCSDLQNSKVLTISNHTSDFDWLFISFVLNKFGLFKRMIISMRDDMKKKPIIGLILRAFNPIFLIRTTGMKNEAISEEELKRRIETNNNRIKEALDRFENEGISPNPLIFVEGTYICKEKYVIWLLKYFESKFEIKDSKLLKEQIKEVVYADKGNFQRNHKENFIRTIESEFIAPLNLKERTSTREIYFPFYTLNPKHHGLVETLLNSSQEYDAIVNCTLMPTPYNRFVWDTYKLNNIVLHGSESYAINILVEKISLSKDIKTLVKQIKDTKRNRSLSMTNSLNEKSDVIENLKADLEEKIFKLLNQTFTEKEYLIEEYLKTDPNTFFAGKLKIKSFKLTAFWKKALFLASGWLIPISISYFIGFPLVYEIYDYINQSSKTTLNHLIYTD